MNKYRIQQKLHTMSHLYLFTEDTKPYFEFHGLKFFQWDFNCIEAHKGEHWLVETCIVAEYFKAAYYDLQKRLNVIVSQVSFLSQCYAEHLNESCIIHKNNSEIAFLRYTKPSYGVPLAFDKDSFKALENLHYRNDINEQFFFYWNDMINATGYSAKLLLICSALEALAKSPINIGGESEKYDFLSKILGQTLKDKIWKKNNLGVRHRLVHGEYFNEHTDRGENYLVQVYEKIIEYFNKDVFKDNLIRNVVSPMRHPEGNKRGGFYFLKQNTTSPNFELKDLINGLDQDFDDYIKNFEVLSPIDIQSKY